MTFKILSVDPNHDKRHMKNHEKDIELIDLMTSDSSADGTKKQNRLFKKFMKGKI